jgi:hypothetical protein
MRFGRVCDYGTANFQQIGDFVMVKPVTVLPNKITAIVQDGGVYNAIFNR